MIVSVVEIGASKTYAILDRTKADTEGVEQMLGSGRARPSGGIPSGAQRRRWRAAFAGALVSSLFVLFMPGAGVPIAPPGTDKLVHVALFAAIACTGRLAGAPPRWLVPALLTYAVASELIQATPAVGRSASVADVAADALGLAVGLYLARRSTSPP